MEMVIFICQNSASTNNVELDMVKARLRSVFLSDSAHARQLLYHAASIIAISRECAVYTPCETMRVFDAYVYILAFVKFAPNPREANSAGGPNSSVTAMTPESANESSSSEATIRQDAVRLDRSPWDRSPTDMIAVELWICKNHGYASIDGVRDICDGSNYDKLKSGALRAIEKLSLWGLSRKFYRTLESFN